jgi:hypothetical protein
LKEEIIKNRLGKRNKKIEKYTLAYRKMRKSAKALAKRKKKFMNNF